jgi:hypothetical protein
MFSIFVSTLLVERLVETICVQMFFFSFTVSGLTPMGGMIDEQPLQKKEEKKELVRFRFSACELV